MEIERRLRKLENLVDLLLSRGNSDTGRISMLMKYMSLLKNGYGLTQENKDLFTKFLLEESKIKKFIDDGVPLYKEHHEFVSSPFNLEENDNLYETIMLYNLTLSNFDIIFEFPVAAMSAIILSKVTNVQLLSVNVHDQPGVITAIFDDKNFAVKLYEDNLFVDSVDVNVRYTNLPIVVRYEVVKQTFSIMTCVISSVGKMELRWFTLGTGLLSEGVISHRRGIGYIVQPGKLPDAVGVLFEGEYRARLRAKEEVLLEKAEGLGLSNYLGLAGLQGSSFIKDLYSHTIQTRSYDYNLATSTSIDHLGALASHRFYADGVVGNDNMAFYPARLNIICGFHDPNDRVPSPNRHQGVGVRTVVLDTTYLMGFDKDDYKPNVDRIILAGDDYYDLPISVNRRETSSGDTIVLPGFLRVTQEINALIFSRIYNTKNGTLVDPSFIVVGQTDYKRKENQHTNWRLFYDGYGYLVGMGSIKEDNLDGYVITADAKVTAKFKLFIDASHALSIDPSQGEYTLQINDVSHTVTSPFVMTKLNFGSAMKTYLASEQEFSYDFNRVIGIQDISHDNASSDHLGLTKADNSGKIINPTDNPVDKYMTTDPAPCGWQWVEGKDLFADPEHMLEQTPNLKLLYTVDSAIFNNRQPTQNVIFKNKVSPETFGWNGMMKPNVNTWSRTGYIASVGLEAYIDVDPYDLWDRSMLTIIPDHRAPKSSFDNVQLVANITHDLKPIFFTLPSTFNYQPATPLKVKVLDIAINNISEVDSSDVNNIFDSNDDLLEIKFDIDLLFRTQRDLIVKMAQLEAKQDKVVEILKKIIDELDQVIKAMQQMSSKGSSIIQDLFNAGMFVLDMFAPSLVLFFAPFALLLLGTISLVNGDLSGGIIDLIAGGIIFGYYHVPLYVVPYGKRFINRYMNFSDIASRFRTWTKRIGNATRGYLPSFRGFYNVRQQQMSLRRSDYTYMMDEYTQRFELVELDLWPPRLSFHVKRPSNQLVYETDKEVKSMVINLSRVFIVEGDDGKRHTIRATIVFTFGGKSSLLSSAHKIGGKSLSLSSNSDVSLEFKLEHRSLLEVTGLFKYTTLTESNYKQFFKTSLIFNDVSQMVYNSMILDYPQSITNYTAQIHDFLDGLVELAANDNIISKEYRAVGLYAPHVNTDTAVFTNNILMSCLGYYGDKYKFPPMES